MRGRPIGLLTFCSSGGPSFFGRPGRLFGRVVSFRGCKLQGDVWTSVPVEYLVGVPSPDLRGLILGEKEIDCSAVGEAEDLLGEDLGVVFTGLPGDDCNGVLEEHVGVEATDLDGDDVLANAKQSLGEHAADFGGECEGEVAKLDGEEPDFVFEVANSVFLGFMLRGPDQEDSIQGSKGSLACSLEQELADFRLYLTPSLSFTGDTNMSLMGLMYWTRWLALFSSQARDLVVFISDLFLRPPEVVFRSFSLFGVECSLRSSLAWQSLSVVPASSSGLVFARRSSLAILCSTA